MIKYKININNSLSTLLKMKLHILFKYALSIHKNKDILDCKENLHTLEKQKRNPTIYNFSVFSHKIMSQQQKMD